MPSSFLCGKEVPTIAINASNNSQLTTKFEVSSGNMLEAFIMFKPFSGAPYSCTSCNSFDDVPRLCLDLQFGSLEAG